MKFFFTPLLLSISLIIPGNVLADGEIDIVKFLQRNCLDCHQGEEAAANYDFTKLQTKKDLIASPELLFEIRHAVSTSQMPPDEDSELSRETRVQATQAIGHLLHHAIANGPATGSAAIRRMTRFQYSNSVRDLLGLKVSVFSLPEQLAREYGNYYQPETGKMPDVVKVGNRALGKSQLIEPRLEGITPYPQDLRAEHGYDNQADQLSLSPILLEQFLELSQSIVNSSNFNAKTVSIWNDVFAAPETGDIETAIRDRLRPILQQAFRTKISETTLRRYSDYAASFIQEGADFTTAMKATVGGILASPRFFYIQERPGDQFSLASRLSFFLWGSIPDPALIEAASKGALADPAILSSHVDRLLLNRRSKRFCDSFPSQWLQLETLISSEPDPNLFKQFYFLRYNGSMHMMIEPLLLFEAVLVEDKSILQFIQSDFSYRSVMLKTWYAQADKIQHTGPGAVDFQRVPITDMREGGLITNAAIMTMTSAPNHTKPISRGAWFATTMLHAPPKPPPADVPPIDRKANASDESLTIREQLATHRDSINCAGCHKKIDPFGFALENYNPVGHWRDVYPNGRQVDSSGVLYNQHSFDDIVGLKKALLKEKGRFATGFTQHLMSFALGRKVTYHDTIAIEEIVQRTAADDFRLKAIIKNLVLSDAFIQPKRATTTASLDSSKDPS